MMQLDPPEFLTFRGPLLTDTVSTSLKLTNPLTKPQIFKIKTTAPKCYCVRPNSGIIKPNDSFTVNIMLQPFQYNPDAPPKHKFMVQHADVPAPDGLDSSTEEVWKTLTQNGVAVSDMKMRCIFEVTAGGRTSAAVLDTSFDEADNAQQEIQALAPSLAGGFDPYVADEVTPSPVKAEPVTPNAGLRQRPAAAPPSRESAPAPVSSLPIHPQPEEVLIPLTAPVIAALLCAFIIGLLFGGLLF